MKTLLTERIKQRLATLNLTSEGASKKAGLDRSYLRALFERNASPTLKTLNKLATALETTPEWLMHGAGTAPHVPPAADVVDANIEIPSAGLMPRDIPVLGVAAGSHTHGAFQMEAAIIDYVRRPPGVATAKDVYGLYVEGDSMAPLHRAGDLLLLHPGRPARIGDSVVVQFKTGECEYPEAMLGILHKRTPKCVELQKLNPAAIVEIETRTIEAIHRTLTMNDLFGV